MHVFVSVLLLQSRHHSFLVVFVKFVFHLLTCHSELSRRISNSLLSLASFWSVSSRLSVSFPLFRLSAHWKCGSALRVPRFCRSGYPATSAAASLATPAESSRSNL